RGENIDSSSPFWSSVFSLQVRLDIRSMDFQGRTYLGGNILSFQSDGEFLAVAASLSASTTVLNQHGEPVPRPIALAIARARIDQKVNFYRPAATGGEVDLDFGEPGPGLTKEEMLGLTDADLEISALSSASFATLQGVATKFKLGTIPLCASKEVFFNYLSDYIDVIRRTREEASPSSPVVSTSEQETSMNPETASIPSALAPASDTGPVLNASPEEPTTDAVVEEDVAAEGDDEVESEEDEDLEESEEDGEDEDADSEDDSATP
ncbi:hypothetical protein KW797_01655, partial [Candidatus Parcubacteria bacterium]|nr:hypothetical protein [Candidatus Parcubacteria bacterium]